MLRETKEIELYEAINIEMVKQIAKINELFRC